MRLKIMHKTALEKRDSIVLDSISNSEREQIARFREAYYSFRESWDDYAKKIKTYRRSR